jgi:opacity protein-like surface antigen
MKCDGKKTVQFSLTTLFGFTLAMACAATTFAQAPGTTEPGTTVGPADTGSAQPADTGSAQIEKERAETASQAQESERAAQVKGPEYHHERPGEPYVAGFGGYTFGHSFNNAQGTGALSGVTAPGIDLANSGIYGAKIGYFLPNRFNWLGLEVEGFNTSPNFKQSAVGPGASLRVTTVAFNLIARGKYACRRSENVPARRTTTETRTDQYGYREDTFCPLQPYVGAGLGVFFAHTNGPGGTTSDSDNAVPGFNGLAGIRYFFTEHVALFAEYKYNRASFNFDNLGGGTALRGDYSVSNIVGGLSFHF